MAAFFRQHGFRTVEMSISRLSSCDIFVATVQPKVYRHTCIRHNHIFAQSRWKKSFPKSSWLQIHGVSNKNVVLGMTMRRWNSSQTAASQTQIPELGSTAAGYIPEPPSLPEPVEIADCLNALGEPTMSSLGLGGMLPNGWVQSAFEMLHVNCGLPWWGAIAVGTVFLRMCMFPLVIKSQKNAAHLHNHLPTMTRLQEKFSRARQSGNSIEAARSGNELMDFMKRNEIKPFKNFLVPMAQLPVFVSMFVGLRQMANLPVESMKLGGMYWFTDLTVPDPFYALPLITMMTFLITVEVGVDGVKANTMSHGMKWFMRAMPIFIFPFIMNFPMALLCYWFVSNTFSLAQVLFLKIPAVREALNIPDLVKHDKSAMPKKPGFVKGFQDTWENSKKVQEMEDREKVDALRFREAGLGPLQKTYSYNPTKLPKSPAESPPKAISAKPKS